MIVIVFFAITSTNAQYWWSKKNSKPPIKSNVDENEFIEYLIFNWHNSIVETALSTAIVLPYGINELKNIAQNSHPNKDWNAGRELQNKIIQFCEYNERAESNLESYLKRMENRYFEDHLYLITNNMSLDKIADFAIIGALVGGGLGIKKKVRKKQGFFRRNIPMKKRQLVKEKTKQVIKYTSRGGLGAATGIYLYNVKKNFAELNIKLQDKYDLNRLSKKYDESRKELYDTIISIAGNRNIELDANNARNVLRVLNNQDLDNKSKVDNLVTNHSENELIKRVAFEVLWDINSIFELYPVFKDLDIPGFLPDNEKYHYLKLLGIMCYYSDDYVRAHQYFNRASSLDVDKNDLELIQGLNTFLFIHENNLEKTEESFEKVKSYNVSDSWIVPVINYSSSYTNRKSFLKDFNSSKLFNDRENAKLFPFVRSLPIMNEDKFSNLFDCTIEFGDIQSILKFKKVKIVNKSELAIPPGSFIVLNIPNKNIIVNKSVLLEDKIKSNAIHTEWLTPNLFQSTKEFLHERWVAFKDKIGVGYEKEGFDYDGNWKLDLNKEKKMKAWAILYIFDEDCECSIEGIN